MPIEPKPNSNHQLKISQSLNRYHSLLQAPLAIMKASSLLASILIISSLLAALWWDSHTAQKEPNDINPHISSAYR